MSLRIRSLHLGIAILGLLAVALPAAASGPAYEYKIERSETVSFTGMNLGKTRELSLDAIEKQMAEEAKNGWRLISADMVLHDSRIGVYSFVFIYERQKGATYVVASPAGSVGTVAATEPPMTPSTPRPERTPRPPPTNDPCTAGAPCVVETHLGSELTIEIGKSYNVRLQSGDVIGGVINAASRLEVTIDSGAKGKRTIPSSNISDITAR